MGRCVPVQQSDWRMVEVFTANLVSVQCGGVYLYSNLIGCDGERVFYDGGSMISMNGQIVAEGPQFTLDEVVSVAHSSSSCCCCCCCFFLVVVMVVAVVVVVTATP